VFTSTICAQEVFDIGEAPSTEAISTSTSSAATEPLISSSLQIPTVSATIFSTPNVPTVPPAPSSSQLLIVSASVVSPNPLKTASQEDDEDSLFSVKLSTPDYKATSDLPISPTHSTPRKQMSQLQQLNTAVLGISTRLSALEEGIFMRLRRIESRLVTMAHKPLQLTDTSSSNYAASAFHSTHF